MKRWFVLSSIFLGELSSLCASFAILQSIPGQRKENEVTISLFVSTSDEVSQQGLDEEELEQRNLRFGGVGRLYTSLKHKDDIKHDPHLEVLDRLSKATVIVVGLGGVGSWAAEALCRSGVGNLVLIDLDDICISNTNRQLHALSSTVGRMKIDEMKNRLSEINPKCNISLVHDFVSEENVEKILRNIPNLTACLDAIDGTSGKAPLIAACSRLRIPIVTCGGSAGLTDPTKFVCEDLARVRDDKLLAACRRTLRAEHGFEEGLPFRDAQGKKNKLPKKWKINAVYSTELPKVLPKGMDMSSFRRCDGALGTACFVTGTSGFIAAGTIVDMIAKDKRLIPRRFFAENNETKA
jgi:tRNA threonylcarbamoyladenosine dehydratase